MRAWIGSVVVVVALGLAVLAHASAPPAPEPHSGTWCMALEVPVGDANGREIQSLRLPDGWRPVGGTTSGGGGMGMANAPMVVACATFP